jgi:hypothetical protein
MSSQTSPPGKISPANAPTMLFNRVSSAQGVEEDGGEEERREEGRRE